MDLVEDTLTIELVHRPRLREWKATTPDMPGVAGYGETRIEAVRQLFLAMVRSRP